jgi:hypothetical protein
METAVPKLAPPLKLPAFGEIERPRRPLISAFPLAPPTPDALNLGLNDGPAAGQTMPQLHFHVSPRYTGDIPDPRGGSRHIIPAKAR